MLFLAGTLLPAVIYLLGATWRVKIIGKEHEESAGKPLIWAFWHSRMLPLVFAYRRQGIVVLVSRSFDGEIISRAIEAFGFRTTRGSSSRGGLRGFLQMIDELKNGALVAFTPDGPRGPAKVVKSGVAGASIKSGAPVIPAEVIVRSKWTLNTWDEFIIPKPFSFIDIMLSKPIYPEGKDIDELTSIIQKRFDEMTAN